VGCGTGWYARALEDLGHVVTGLDRAPGQVRQLLERRVEGTGAIADARALPCAGGAFDFVYSVNVIHHLPGRAAQAEALAEVRRALRPDGLFFLHEINVVNPLHRFYMVFLFPVLKNIDEGTEHWILPGETALFEGFERVSITYFTFLPDFLPAWALRLLRPVERWLERSPLKRLSAHYMLVLRKQRPG
jgi:SAM-dependent methyltransferase